MRRERDSQKGRVYAAERELPEWQHRNPKLMTTHAIEKYLNRLTTYKWYRKQFNRRIYIDHDYRGRNYHWGHGSGLIQIGSDGLGNEMMVLHEAAHAIAGNLERHGPYYVYVYITLIERKLGKEVADRMRAACRKHNVDWSSSRGFRGHSPRIPRGGFLGC